MRRETLPAAHCASAAAVLEVETLTRLAAAEAIAPAWRALEATSGHATFFQSCAWCLYVWRTRAGIAHAAGPAPRVMVIRQAGAIVAIWPLAIREGLAGRYAQDLTEPFGQYSDLLVAEGADEAAIRDAAFAELRRWRIDGLVLRKVREDARLATWLATHGVRVGTREEAPEVGLEQVGGHEAYRRALNAKTRKNLRNYRNRLSREGELRHAVLDAPGSAADPITSCFDGRKDWLASSGLSSTAFADPAFRSIVDGLATGARGAPPVVAMRQSLVPGTAAAQPSSEIDLSLHWGFEHAGRYYAFMASKNAAYDAFSPGRLHLEDVIAAQAARGVATVDLLVPALPYKLSMATGAVGVATWAVPLSLRGRLAISGWHGRMRPALKAALLRLSPRMRRAVMTGREVLARLRA